jgi:hypothetical protein
VIRLARLASAVALVALTTGCPAFVVDRGEIVSPSRELTRPTPRALPAASTYVDLQDRWRRELRLGLGGHAVGTLVDPALAAAEVAHEAALQDLRGAALDTLLANRWATYYGTELDRFPIDVEWRFDEQFITKPAILDPANWEIKLHTSSARSYAPLSVAVLSSEPKPRDGQWTGRIRLWFPWRDAETGNTLVGGATSWVSLSLDHPSGSGDMTWRFRTLF